MKIKSIEVQGLWHLYDLKWDLNPTVNILTGINGAGKTTLFDLSASLLSTGKLPVDYAQKADKIIVTFDDGSQLTNINFDNTLAVLKRKASKDAIYREIWNDVSEKFTQHERRAMLTDVGIQASICKVKHKGRNIPIKPFLDKLNVRIHSTFDDPLSSSLDKVSIVSLRESGVKSSLDLDLKEKQEKYALYLADLANSLEHYAIEARSLDMEYIKHLYEKKNIFMNILDTLFADTHKRVDRRSSKLCFITEPDNARLEVSQLSSGEKQILSILIEVLLQEEKECVFYMDEPEISLHVDWQEQLIDIIRVLNPNCQLLLASHAPAMLMRGWHEAVQNIEDLKKYSNGI